jgi:DNA-binding beta-propeller fold protein YncE
MLATLLCALYATAIPLPGARPVGMDYLAYDRATNRVWIPAGNTGNVDVFDVATGKLTAIGGFATAAPRRPGRPRMGPSSATVGEGVVWIGNRANNQLAAFDERTLSPRGVIELPSTPDGLAYVRTTHELWATTPGSKTVTIAKAETKTTAAIVTIGLDGAPEGYAVDDRRGIFYTNLEDRDRTVAIDIKTRRVLDTWPSGCGVEGPRGLALDVAQRWLFVACTDGVGAFDAGRGKSLGRIRTAGGVDNLDYQASTRLLFIASAKGGALIVAHVDDLGTPRTVVSIPTAQGARNAVLDASGAAYVPDSTNGRLLVVTASNREEASPPRRSKDASSP